jgi:cytochrome c nitrite reductase small subunit
MKEFLNQIPNRFILPLFIVGGVIAGLSVYIIYMSRAHSYLSDDPSACINCHVMIPYYQSWSRSSHTHWTNCNDCHIPQNNVFSKYTFKLKDGVYHSAVFTIKGESQAIRPTKSSYNVIMKNCIRCHTQLNTEFVKTGMITYSEAKKGKGKPCWDCHTQVPHTHISSLSSSPNAIVASSNSAVPDWLKNIMKKNQNIKQVEP